MGGTSSTTTARVYAATSAGVDGVLIEVECDSSNSLPGLSIVGLGNKAIDEAKERVRSAIKNTGLSFPAKRIVINLAPATLPKDGSHFDVPIALAILVVSGQLLPSQIQGKLFAGELALDGSIRPIRGALQIAEAAASADNISQVILPAANASQAALVSDIDVIGVNSLRSLFLLLKGERTEHTNINDALNASSNNNSSVNTQSNTIDTIFGQESAKRALIIAAAGHHNLLFDGPPGAGKTMLAKALAHLLPPMSRDEIIAVTKLHSLAGEADDRPITDRPFRAPHHTASHVSLVGGGNHPKPGEISLAHHGVLFLDELPEYPRASLESLRQPLEDREVNVARAAGRVRFPASFMLVATQNPCPCGYFGDPTRECSCSMNQILNYQKRVSGPLLDRIDMIVPVARVDHDKLLAQSDAASSEHDKAKNFIQDIRTVQNDRYKTPGKTNAAMTNADIKKHANLTASSEKLLNSAADTMQLSARGYFKIIKVARTIADLAGSHTIEPAHIAEALQYRMKK